MKCSYSQQLDMVTNSFKTLRKIEKLLQIKLHFSFKINEILLS